MTPLSQSNVSETPESQKCKIKTCEHDRRMNRCKAAEEVVYANMEEKKVDAKSAEEAVYANMGGAKVYAKSAEEVIYANMEVKEVDTKSAEEVVYANMEENEVDAKTVEEAAYANMGSAKVYAKSGGANQTCGGRWWWGGCVFVYPPLPGKPKCVTVMRRARSSWLAFHTVFFFSLKL